MTTAVRLLAGIMFLLGSLAGGCSLVFSFQALSELWRDFDPSILLVWLSGFGFGALFFRFGITLWRTKV